MTSYLFDISTSTCTQNVHIQYMYCTCIHVRLMYYSMYMYCPLQGRYFHDSWAELPEAASEEWTGGEGEAEGTGEKTWCYMYMYMHVHVHVHLHCTCIVFSLGKQYAMHETLNMAALSLSLSRMKTSIWRWSGYSRKYSLVAHPLEPTSLPDLAPPQQRTRSVLLLLIHTCTCTCRCDHWDTLFQTRHFKATTPDIHVHVQLSVT